MQTSNTEFIIREYGNDGLMLIRNATRDYVIEGLPTQSSQMILMTNHEVTKLKELIDTYYADKNRDPRV